MIHSIRRAFACAWRTDGACIARNRDESLLSLVITSRSIALPFQMLGQRSQRNAWPGSGIERLFGDYANSDPQSAIQLNLERETVLLQYGVTPDSGNSCYEYVDSAYQIKDVSNTHLRFDSGVHLEFVKMCVWALRSGTVLNPRLG